MTEFNELPVLAAIRIVRPSGYVEHIVFNRAVRCTGVHAPIWVVPSSWLPLYGTDGILTFKAKDGYCYYVSPDTPLVTGPVPIGTQLTINEVEFLPGCSDPGCVGGSDVGPFVQATTCDGALADFYHAMAVTVRAMITCVHAGVCYVFDPRRSRVLSIPTGGTDLTDLTRVVDCEDPACAQACASCIAGTTPRSIDVDLSALGICTTYFNQMGVSGQASGTLPGIVRANQISTDVCFWTASIPGSTMAYREYDRTGGAAGGGNVTSVNNHLLVNVSLVLAGGSMPSSVKKRVTVSLSGPGALSVLPIYFGESLPEAYPNDCSLDSRIHGLDSSVSYAPVYIRTVCGYRCPIAANQIVTVKPLS